MPDCGVHYLWFAFVCFLIRSHPPSPFPPVDKHIPGPGLCSHTPWSGIVVAICTSLRLIEQTLTRSASEIDMSLQDFLICVEMLLVALAFRKVFSYRPFVEGCDENVLNRMPPCPPPPAPVALCPCAPDAMCAGARYGNAMGA